MSVKINSYHVIQSSNHDSARGENNCEDDGCTEASSCVAFATALVYRKQPGSYFFY